MALAQEGLMCSIPGVEKHCRALLQEGCGGREGARYASQWGLQCAVGEPAVSGSSRDAA